MTRPRTRLLRAIRRTVLRFVVPPDDLEEVIGDFDEATARYGEEAGPLRGRMRVATELWAFVWRAGMARIAEVAGDWRSAFGRGGLAEVRQTLRSLRRRPLVPALSVVTLALGIGGASAVFAVTDQVILRPLPFEEPDRLFALRSGYRGESWWSVAPAEALAMAESPLVERIGWTQRGTVTLLEADRPVLVDVLRASADLVATLGITPTVGRGFEPGEDREGSAPGVLLTERSWLNRFGGDPEILGRSLVLDGVPHAVLGVLPDAAPLSFLGDHDIIVPYPLSADARTERGRVLQAIARLRSGADPAAAAADLTARLQASGGGSLIEGWTIQPVPLKDEVVEGVRSALWVLLTAIGCLLVIACLNVGNLLLARGNARKGELALRRALGAGRGRITRQLALESLFISGTGGLLGLLLGAGALSAFSEFAVQLLPAGVAPTLDLRASTVALFFALLAGLTFGVLPALAATRVGEEGRVHGARAGLRRADGRAGDVLVASEMACVVVLVSGAVLMGLVLRQLGSDDPGFSLDPLTVLEVALPADRFPTVEDQVRFSNELREVLQGAPGVAAVGTVSNEPFGGGDWTAFHVTEDAGSVVPGEEPTGGVEFIDDGYFDALGVDFIAGRPFDRVELSEEAAVGIVNDALARRYWPDRNPIGRRIRYGPTDSDTEVEVVGVVSGVKYAFGADVRPRLYLPDARQFGPQPTRTFVVRADRGDAAGIAGTVRRVAERAVPDLPIAAVVPMTERARTSLAGARFQALLMGVFAVVGLALGVVGVYGVVSHAVGRRRSEVGVRLALGASRGSVVRRVVGRALVPAVLGGLPAVLVVLGLSRWLDGRIPGGTPAGPGPVLLVAAALLGIAALAALVPAVRAGAIDPVGVLREE